MSQFGGLRLAVEMPSQAPLVPPGSNSHGPIRGLTKLLFQFLTNLAKTLTVRVRG